MPRDFYGPSKDPLRPSYRAFGAGHSATGLIYRLKENAEASLWKCYDFRTGHELRSRGQGIVEIDMVFFNLAALAIMLFLKWNEPLKVVSSTIF